MTAFRCSAIVTATDPAAEGQVEWTKQMFEWGYARVFEAWHGWLAEQASRGADYFCNQTSFTIKTPHMTTHILLQTSRFYPGDAFLALAWAGWVYVNEEIKRVYPTSLALLKPPPSPDKMPTPIRH